MLQDAERNEAVRLTGRSTRRAWKAGAIADRVASGMTLDEAKAAAERAGELVDTDVADNLVVDAGDELVGDLLIDVEGTGLTYHAVGTGATAPSPSDTTLTTEQFRKQWTTRDRAANVLTLSVFYVSSEVTFSLEEAGVFGGDAASATANSGTLFSHYLQSYDNSAGNFDLTYDYELTIG